jgi:hypothetical protein
VEGTATLDIECGAHGKQLASDVDAFVCERT